MIEQWEDYKQQVDAIVVREWEWKLAYGPAITS
jgi:hypothetical protein